MDSIKEKRVVGLIVGGLNSVEQWFYNKTKTT